MALDELGRGTATMDGVAIASAVLERVTDTLGCRGVFATHYHVLADDFAEHPRVAVKHMACRVEHDVASSVPKVCGGQSLLLLLFLLSPTEAYPCMTDVPSKRLSSLCHARRQRSAWFPSNAVQHCFCLQVTLVLRFAADARSPRACR